MSKEELIQWYKSECNKDIAEGWDSSIEECLDFIVRDSYAIGYNKAREFTINKAKQWIKDNYWTCSNAEEYSEDFVKFMYEE